VTIPHGQLSALLPELAVLVRRDGVLLDHLGGQNVKHFQLPKDCVGMPLQAFWDEESVTALMQVVRRAIADRSPADTWLRAGESTYEVRASPQGPDRAICVLRLASAKLVAEPPAQTDAAATPGFDRRGFMRRLKALIAGAQLRERPIALVGIRIEGLADIARVIDDGVAEQVLSAALARLMPEAAAPEIASSGQPPWYMGHLSHDTLALVIESADRVVIDRCMADVCAKLRAPVPLGDATFHLTPYAGVAILGQDSTTLSGLLDHARAAAAEARRSDTQRIRYFTDTMKLRSLARLDIAHELRDAVAKGDIRLRFVGRHDLATGQRVARLGYLTWVHPVRGEIRPAEFIGVAEATGLSLPVSRAVFECLRQECAHRAGNADPDVRLSIGPLRQHVLDRDFAADLARFLKEDLVPPARLEIRISERAFLAMDSRALTRIHDLGVHLVVDEVGREISSLARLARVPLSGLQLDRSWANKLRGDPLAVKVCRAGIAVATALGLTPIASGVDDAERCAALLGLGCRYGLGDHFPAEERLPVNPRRRATAIDR
jgi:predicted signal transduction protein with EAL and GGDEF domain